MVRPRRNRQRRNRKYGRGKPYIRNGKIYFGGKVRKGGPIPLFSVLGNLAKGLLEGVTNQEGLVKKEMRRKNNYVMRRLNTSKRVTLPNGRTFIAR